MYGLIGRIRTALGRRSDLIAVLAEGADGMAGCRSYVIAEDPDDPDVLWITEVWDSEDAHRASLDLPEVRAAITRGKPLIAGFEMHQTTVPVAGI